MTQLARALLNLAAFLELSGDDASDQDASMEALEQLSADLQSAGAQELEALATAADELAAEARAAGLSDRAAFFASFFDSFGIENDR